MADETEAGKPAQNSPPAGGQAGGQAGAQTGGQAGAQTGGQAATQTGGPQRTSPQAGAMQEGALQQSNNAKNAVGATAGSAQNAAAKPAAAGGLAGAAEAAGVGAPPPAADSTLTPEELAILNNEGEHLDPRVLDLSSPTGSRDLEAVYDIGVQVSAVLGKSELPVSGLLKLGRDSVVELDRRVGEAIDIYVNNRLVARGEVVVVEDRLGVTMTEIIKSDKSTF